MRDMTKILPVGTRVMVTPFPPSELEPFIGEITGNDIVTVKAGQPFGWYWVTDEMGHEHEVLPSIIEVATEVIVKGYNDDTAGRPMTRQEATAKVVALLAKRGVQGQTGQILLLIGELVELLGQEILIVKEQKEGLR